MPVKLPGSLLDTLNGLPGYDREAFEQAHSFPEQITSIRLNPSKISSLPSSIGGQDTPASAVVPWSRYGYYLDKRPSFTFDPLFHAGCYYVQEASSMFIEQAIKQTTDLQKPLKILDLSASPGGKSTHLQSLVSKDSLVVSNEVIRSRANILKENMVKWGASNVVITHNDPREFNSLQNYFDIIVVDAPCSGSGLFRRDPLALEEWSENNVNLCSHRQQRILADILPSLKKEGVLIYSTCSYSPQEDEDIVDWVLNHKEDGIQQFGIIPINIEPGWSISESGGGYRFWPHKLAGEGFFMACFRKHGGEAGKHVKSNKRPAILEKKELELVTKWLNTNDTQLIKHQQTVYAWPSSLAEDFNYLLQNLRVIYSGTLAGELMRDKLIPSHELAMSQIASKNLPASSLTYEQAIFYLQRKDFSFDRVQTGWQLVKYEGHPLGWVNVLPNRVNNYYPKELRILKDSNSSV